MSQSGFINQSSVIVLGMHRSGTSVLAGTLRLLGICIGDSLMPAHEDINPKGFWEHAGVVDLHDRLLASIGSSWNDERALPERWWLLPRINEFRRELSRMLRREFSNVELWAIKDPRMCRLMPLWGEVLKEIGCKPRVIIILRDPREVAQSLAARDGMAEERSALLWLRYMLDAERSTRNYPRAIVTFEDFLGNWRGAIGKIEDALELGLSYDVSVQQRVEEFIEPSLKHHVPTEPFSGRIMTLALSVYHAWIISNGAQDLGSRLAGAEPRVSEFADPVIPWSGEIQMLRRRLDFCETELSNRKGELIGLRAELSRVKKTFSWRITAPLRVAKNFGWRLCGRFLEIFRKGRKKSVIRGGDGEND